jgi:hypothetical protein
MRLAIFSYSCGYRNFSAGFVYELKSMLGSSLNLRSLIYGGQFSIVTLIFETDGKELVSLWFDKFV